MYSRELLGVQNVLGMIFGLDENGFGLDFIDC